MKTDALTPTLGLFAKEPRPGLVKTRLASATSSAWAAKVAHAFLVDTIRRFGRIQARRALAFAPATAEKFFTELVDERFQLAPQSAGDLGLRMSYFFTNEFAGGAGRVVIIGTDSPTLPVEFINRAFVELDRSDLVLGPATDGGYYLIGCRTHFPELFRNISWSSSSVLLDTAGHARDLGLSLSLLPPWYDVDTLDDWRMLQGHVAAMRLAGIEPDIPATEELLKNCGSA